MSSRFHSSSPLHALLWFAVVVVLSAQAHATSAGDTGPRTRTTFDYGVGTGAIQVRDDLLRPLRWTGVSVTIDLGFDVDTARTRHEGGLGLGFAPLWNRDGHQGLMITQSLHYAFGAKVAGDSRGLLFVGAAYRYESLDSYYADWDDSFLYWFTTHTLAPLVRFETRALKASRLSAAVELPFVGLLSRPTEERIYKVDPLPYPLRWFALTNQHPVVVGPTDLFAPTLRLRWDRSFGRHLGLRIGLDLTYRRALEPKGYFAFGQRLLVEGRHVF